MPYAITDLDGESVEADIIIDTKEQESSFFYKRLIQMLEIEKITFKRHNLTSGDYFVNRGRTLKIEMKSVGDLINAFTGKMQKHGDRLSNQLTDLKIDTFDLQSLTDLANKAIDFLNPSDIGIKLSAELMADIIGLVGMQDYDSACFLIRGGSSVRINYSINISQVEEIVRGKSVLKKELKNDYDFQYEDDKGIIRHANIHPNAWIGIKRKIQHFVPIVETANVDATISWIISQVKSQKKLESEIKKGVNPALQKLRETHRDISDSEIILGIFQGFPGVGTVTSQKTALKYKTLRKFFAGVKTLEDLKECGMNEPTSKNVLRLLDYEYKPDV